MVHKAPLCVPAAQRSAHELPMVEKQDMDSCSVLGGQQMILTGQNFSSDSKVIFMEKTQGEWQRNTSDHITPIYLFSVLARLHTFLFADLLQH